MTRWFRAFLLGAFLCSPAAAAEVDNEVWTSAGVRVRLHKDVRLDFTQHVRFDQNISSLESVLPECSVAWRVQKWLRLGAGYRYSLQRRKDLAFTPEHRLHFQAAVQGGLGPLSLSYRARFQKRFEADPDWERKHTVRNRLQFEYDTKTLFTPGVAVEQYTVVGAGGPSVQERRRHTAMLQFSPHRSHALEGFVRRQRSLDEPTAPLERIFGLEYQYRLPRK